MSVRILADIDSGHELTVTKKPKRKYKLPPFDGIGGNMRLKTKVEPYPNLFGVLKNLSKTATWLFWSLLEERDYKTNIAIFKVDNPVDARRVSNGYKELALNQLVLRYKQQHYLINPKAYLPEFSEYETVQEMWDSYQKEEK